MPVLLVLCTDIDIVETAAGSDVGAENDTQKPPHDPPRTHLQVRESLRQRPHIPERQRLLVEGRIDFLILTQLVLLFEKPIPRRNHVVPARRERVTAFQCAKD